MFVTLMVRCCAEGLDVLKKRKSEIFARGWYAYNKSVKFLELNASGSP